MLFCIARTCKPAIPSGMRVVPAMCECADLRAIARCYSSGFSRNAAVVIIHSEFHVAMLRAHKRFFVLVGVLILLLLTLSLLYMLGMNYFEGTPRNFWA